MEFGYIDAKKREEFKTVILDGYKGEGFTLTRPDGNFRKYETMEEVVESCKKSTGLVHIADLSSDSNIFLSDGVCVWHEDMHDINWKYLDRVWRGIERNEDEDAEEGNTRYSIYDVYRESELL